MAKLLDPVCGMTVDDTALRADGYDDVAFCAPGCRKSFLDDPDAFTDRLDTVTTASPGGGCMCSSAENTGRTAHAGHGDHSGHRMELVDTSASSGAASGCCGGHGH